jgi:protein-disulfide isomerase
MGVRMFDCMTRFLVLLLAVAACRPTDGGARGAAPPGGTTTTAQPAAVSRADSQRVDSLLQLADLGRIQGSATAPVWLVEISDFQCPYCAQWHEQIYPAIKRDYIDRGIVRMAYVHLPLNIHPNAEPASETSLCAAMQNRFWPVHDRLFETQKQWAGMPNPAAFFDSLALASGVEESRYRSCMASGIMRRVINGDKARAAASGVTSTPWFFVGNEPIRGLAPLDAYRQAIERARANAAGRSP